MTDKLFVTYTKDNEGTGLCVGREKDGRIKILKMVLDEEADRLYELLTNQSVKELSL